MNRLRPALALLAILLLTQGCSGLLTSDQPAKQTYFLTPLVTSSPAVASNGTFDLALDVAAVPGLDTDRVLALGTDARLQPVSNARWADHLPEVLTSVLQRSLESTGQFASVHTSDRAPDGGWLLQLEVREFFGILDGTGNTSSVRVSLAGSIQCNGERHLLSLDEANPVAEQRLASVVAAHQAGLDGLTRELVKRIEQVCNTGGAQ
jgi:ABC-type uncharacterized transport system auxiliary subunit